MKNIPRESLPKWTSHKVVRAAKIFRVDKSIPCLVVIRKGEERGLLPRTEEFWKRMEPFRGLAAPDTGYYVLYEDGFESWSPTKAFEEGYEASQINHDDVLRPKESETVELPCPYCKRQHAPSECSPPHPAPGQETDTPEASRLGDDRKD